MNTNKISTTSFGLQLICISSSAFWACVEKPSDVDILRAGDATTDIPETSGSQPESVDVEPGEPEDPNEQIPPPDEEGCHAIYAQDLLPTFELTIDEDTWDDLEWEWKNGSKQNDKGLDPDPYHSLLEFRYGDVVITDAEIRLRGNPDAWDNSEDKFQFHIAFDRVDDDGHFLGLEALAFDASEPNRHMLRDRLALSIIRDMGVMATCANNARLNINGEYYGLFTNLEKLDKVFLERAFDDPSGDLWQRQSWDLHTNKDTANEDRLDALKDAETIEELETYLDVGQALKVYAAEAIIPDSDGGWAGGMNFFLYDDPLTGVFKLLPWDMDSTFDRFNDGLKGEYPDNPDPVVWHKKNRYHGRPWYDLALEDEDWFWYYIESIEEQFEAAYDVDVLHEKIATWTDQIKESVFDDPNKPFSNQKYMDEVEDLEDFVEARHDWMEEWLECWEQGGEPDDDGYCED
jgi:spore coat protein CotH